MRATSPGQRDDGSAAVEFAILVPTLILLVAGILGLGLYLYAAQSANFGAREGARLAAVGVNDCAAWRASIVARSGFSKPSNIRFSYSGTPQPGATLTVTMDYQNNGPANSLLAAATALFPGGALQLPSHQTATATSRAEVIGSVTQCS